MSTTEAAISFRTLLAYTDYLAQRWVEYFKQNPAALEVDVGGKTGRISDLVTHIFQAERFFAGRLMNEDVQPPGKSESLDMPQLVLIHETAHGKLTKYIAAATEEELNQTRAFGQFGNVSNRKMLTQAVLHSIHHWAQVAMEVRQSGFPTGKPQDILISPVME